MPIRAAGNGHHRRRGMAGQNRLRLMLGTAEGGTAEPDFPSVDNRDDTLPRDLLHAIKRLAGAGRRSQRPRERMARSERQPPCRFQHAGRDMTGIDQFGNRQGQRSRLVKDDRVDLGEPFECVARLQQHMTAEQHAGRNHLHGRDRQAERAGTGDDQHGDRDDQRRLPGRPGSQPGDEGGERGDMHDGRIEPGGTVGEPQIARAVLHRPVDEPRDIVEQGAAPRGRNANPEHAATVQRAGMDRRARLDRHARGFAGDEALVDGRGAVDHDAIHADPLAGPDEDKIAWQDRADRHLLQPSVHQLDHRLGLQRGNMGRHRMGLAAHQRVEIAAGEQEEQQHHRAVEIGVVGVP